MSNYKERCKERMPDCFNCPYPDCIATQRDITRQDGVQREVELEKRNKRIVKLFLGGADIEGLSERFNMTTGAIKYVLTKANVDYRKVVWERTHGGFNKSIQDK